MSSSQINFGLTPSLSEFSNINAFEPNLLSIQNLSQSMSNGDIVIIPIIDIQVIKELKEELENKNFKTKLNLIQTYKSLSIAEGMRSEPNNPVFLLKGKKYI